MPSLQLDPNEVHIWILALPPGAPPPVVRSAARERTSAVLSRYVNASPDRVPIVRSASGRPSLSPPYARIRFSVSHAGEWMLVGVGRDQDIGVDVERIRAVDEGAVMQRFFTPDEVECLHGALDEKRREVFFRLWVGKEAYLKGVGGSVPSGLRQVALDPDTGRVTQTAFEPAGSVLRIHWLDPPRGYVAAVCLHRTVHEVRLLRGTDDLTP